MPLDDAAVERSRAKFGSNVLPIRKKKSFLSKFVKNLNDPIIRILLVALAVNLILTFKNGDLIETIGIAVSVFAAAFISTLSECGGDAAFAKLADGETERTCRVKRARGIFALRAERVVVGDIILLGAGESVCADGLLIEGKLRLDMSAMTGESRDVEKKPSNDSSLSPASPSSLLRGCLVTSGEGEMVVTAVGANTVIGGISREVNLDVRDSPLKIRLSKLARQISLLGYAAAFLVAAAYIFNALVLDSGTLASVIIYKLTNPQYMLSLALDAFTLGLTVIVVAVPEGLPMMIAVILSSNMKRMVRAGVLVKKPVGIEAAGSMNILFTDKTGTLTEGNMSLCSIVTPDNTFGDFASFHRSLPQAASDFLLSVHCNTSAVLGTDETGKLRPIGGNATERALLAAVLKEHAPSARIVSKIPFASERKYSVAKVAGRSGDVTLVKGAPDVLINRITCAASEKGDVPIDRFSFAKKLSTLCSGGARALILARSRTDAKDPGAALPELCLICAVILRDKTRREASASVQELQGAGIRVVMLTGDGKETASAVARECGIIKSGADLVMDSSELAELDDARLRALLPRLAVVSRAMPSDKSRLVAAAQSSGLVVGMTGDGINDSPALRSADVGFSMGSGSDVAKEASDVVILDDNIKSISRAVLYGRNVFKSIRKFITLQLTMNLCACAVSMIGPFIGIDAPVTVVQMLWINVIMDTLGGLAFAGEAPLASYMREKPKRRDEPILNGYMVSQISFLGLFTVILSIMFLKHPSFIAHFRVAPGDICHLTGFFAFFIFAGVFNCFNCRNDRISVLSGIRKNHAFIAIMLAVLCVQIAFVYLGGKVLRTVPLTASELIFSLMPALTVFPADILRKLIRRFRKRGDGEKF